MKQPQSCISCGVGIPPGFAEASCPACLMELGVHGHSADDSTSAGETSAGERAGEPPRTDDDAQRPSSHGPARSDHMSGQTVAHYRLQEQIGQGGMGVVWSAEDTVLKRTVAIKFLPADVAGQAERLARFEREAKLLASLNHPAHRGDLRPCTPRATTRFLVRWSIVAGDELAERLEARSRCPSTNRWRSRAQIARGDWRRPTRAA